MITVGILIIIGWGDLIGSIRGYNIASTAAMLIAGYPLVKAVIDIKVKAITADVFMALGAVAAACNRRFPCLCCYCLFMLIAEYLDKLTMDKAKEGIG